MAAFDAQKARKVLKRVEKFLGILIRENLVKDAPFLGEGELENESDLADDVWEVLQMQLRNCDMGTVEEQKERFMEFCDDEKGDRQHCRNCRLCNEVDCELAWAQMPYEAEEGEGERAQMPRLNEVEPVYVEYMPENPEPGKLYISEKFRTATHLCPCGCGNRVVTPLKSGFWTKSERDGRVTIRPSIGSFDLPCRSHYFITDNEIEWISAAQEGANNA